MEWQSIETAPRDGTDVLLWLHDAGACCGYYHYDRWWADNGDAIVDPTHWMPLPRPPSDKGET
jgi:hypothetical protein